ncbi:CbiX/SirB N-terminal domain-containing protein [Halosimplex salinum]|uniref:CbiX/SirB N-terminal domain-containing protein n=1 Tax=Halosimplex salinum TaxID=1710538 RepID=UPI000F4A2D00|nr:CbiX/SirB N-terminal domain-containing protein [Halosimplex salinum]
MTTETVLLVGRERRNGRAVLRTHAERLRERGLADRVAVATYERDPAIELSEQFAEMTADTVYAVPMCAAHSHETTEAVPSALASLTGGVRYCDPVGASPAVTDVIEERGADLVAGDEDVSLVLVGFGSSSKPYHRRTVDYHATRLRERTDYGEVVTCYLLQNPAVECVRYNVSNDSAVAVPLFLTRTEATEERVPAELELDRGGMAYADPFGTHPRVTDAVSAEVEKQRALASAGGAGSVSVDATPGGPPRPVATDGDGGRRR